MLECELRVLEALEYYLVVFHPYRPLLQCVLRPVAVSFLLPSLHFPAHCELHPALLC